MKPSFYFPGGKDCLLSEAQVVVHEQEERGGLQGDKDRPLGPGREEEAEVDRPEVRSRLHRVVAGGGSRIPSSGGVGFNGSARPRRIFLLQILLVDSRSHQDRSLLFSNKIGRKREAGRGGRSSERNQPCVDRPRKVEKRFDRIVRISAKMSSHRISSRQEVVPPIENRSAGLRRVSLEASPVQRPATGTVRIEPFGQISPKRSLDTCSKGESTQASIIAEERRTVDQFFEQFFVADEASQQGRRKRLRANADEKHYRRRF